METKLHFLRDEFDNTYKIFATLDDGQNIIIGRFEFTDEQDLVWNRTFIKWICSHSLPREVTRG